MGLAGWLVVLACTGVMHVPSQLSRLVDARLLLLGWCAARIMDPWMMCGCVDVWMCECDVAQALV